MLGAARDRRRGRAGHGGSIGRSARSPPRRALSRASGSAPSASSRRPGDAGQGTGPAPLRRSSGGARSRNRRRSATRRRLVRLPRPNRPSIGSPGRSRESARKWPPGRVAATRVRPPPVRSRRNPSRRRRPRFSAPAPGGRCWRAIALPGRSVRSPAPGKRGVVRRGAGRAAAGDIRSRAGRVAPTAGRTRTFSRQSWSRMTAPSWPPVSVSARSPQIWSLTQVRSRKSRRSAGSVAMISSRR